MHLHKRKLLVIISMITIASVLTYSCKKTEENIPTEDPFTALNIPSIPLVYSQQILPPYLFSPAAVDSDNTPANNPVSDWGATLGRVLFYDKILSFNNVISCANCHKQNAGFSDDLVLSKGFENGLTGRHSMSIINAKYYGNGRFFWDERAFSLENQVLVPVQDHIEMGMNLDTLIKRLNSKTHYPALFQRAFGTTSITRDKIANALSQFVRSIISYRSKYDEGRQIIPTPNYTNIAFPNFTAQENQGKQLFFSPATNCATCHNGETFTAPGPRNNGLDNPSPDAGVGGINNNPGLIANFKVSSLKSIALTAPYMHDGRFATLEQVIEHYDSGVKPHPNLSPQLRNPDGSPRRLNLTAEQKAALVAFLRTLTDNGITNDEKFSNPFR